MQHFIISFIILLGFSTQAHGEVFKEFVGLRSLSMGGAHRGLGTSNDTIYLNPAGMALSRRYSIDAVYAHDGIDNMSHLNISALDSKSSAVSGATGYMLDKGNTKGRDVTLHRFYVSSAYRITQSFAFGLSGKHLRGDFLSDQRIKQHVSTYAADVGLAWMLGQYVGVGVTYKNLLSSSRPRLTPPSVGTGLGISYQNFSGAADLLIDLHTKRKGEVSFHSGVEYFLDGQFPIRFGYRMQYYDGLTQRLREHIIGGGIGWLNTSGALEVAYTQSINRAANWRITGALKFFM